MERRYQASGDGEVWSGLVVAGWQARRKLRRVLRQSDDVAEPVRWHRRGDGWQTSETYRSAARAIVADAAKRKGRTDYDIAKKAHFRLLVGLPTFPPVPDQAAKTAATRATLAFHEEMQLVFPDWKGLGLYVARPLKDDMPSGWQIGDPWPANAYASEHAWAAADDTGMKDNADPGRYETDPARLYVFLHTVTEYILANYRRLAVNEHIFDGRAYRAAPSTHRGYLGVTYSGSDLHKTHTHTQFADHDGAKPPWLP